ncbi:hypothetical protein J2T31_001052 [Kerstersia gyiorum]|nr:hypothetical protein [Kerstersia gyiorum]MCP1825054.1 hypothetical protein [Kerstersia gyiorum]MCP1828508.1 hypothetical protein [Kerstersia gyiorum]MCW2450434.1 hypothetical protein [Kerstersia gyiorum]
MAIPFFGGDGQAAPGARTCQLEGVAQDAVGALAGEDRLLDNQFAVRPFEQTAAQIGVFAFRVFAHDEEVDVSGLAACQRARHAFEQAYRPQVDVLVEFTPELQQRTPEGNVVGHTLGPADGAEVDGVIALQLAFPVVGHHGAGAFVVVAAGPFEMIELQGQAMAAGGSFQDAQAFGHDFLANAVASQHGDFMSGFHGVSPSCFARDARYATSALASDNPTERENLVHES